jgi:hypothetical protein
MRCPDYLPQKFSFSPSLRAPGEKNNPGNSREAPLSPIHVPAQSKLPAGPAAPEHANFAENTIPFIGFNP